MRGVPFENITRDWLLIKYTEQCLTCRQIATIIGCHERTINQRLVIYDIPRRRVGWQMANLKKWREENPDWLKHNRKKRRGFSQEYKDRRSFQYRGKGNPNWKGGRTLEIKGIRRSPEYYQWRKSVLRKYNFTCQQCGSTELPQAHHVFCVVDYPDKIMDINNGIVLCAECHKKLNFTTNGRGTT